MDVNTKRTVILMVNDVFFEAKRLKGKNKCCDGCFAIGKVTELKIQLTEYYNHQPETIHNIYWFCDTCKTKLINALKDGEKDG